MNTAIQGYSFGAAGVPRTPVSFEDLEKIKATLMWTEDDDRALRQAGEVLDDKVEGDPRYLVRLRRQQPPSGLGVFGS